MDAIRQIHDPVAQSCPVVGGFARTGDQSTWGDHTMMHALHLGKPSSTLATTLALLVAGVALAPGALAAKYPQTAELRDAAGTTSGCVATAGLPSAGKPKGQLSIAVSGTCNPAWERLRVDAAVFEVMPDGTQVTVLPRGEVALATGNVTDVGAGLQIACSKGPHDYIGRWWVKVKHSLNDPNPYQAVVESRATITCR
jgi:hypothetical protein